MLWIVRMCIVWRFDLRRYPDSTGILESYKWRLPGVVRVEGGSYGHVRDLKYELVGIEHMRINPMHMGIVFEVWNTNWSKQMEWYMTGADI